MGNSTPGGPPPGITTLNGIWFVTNCFVRGMFQGFKPSPCILVGFYQFRQFGSLLRIRTDEIFSQRKGVGVKYIFCFHAII